MKRPFDEVIDIYSENLERVRENQIRNFENSEKFMVWIVGFAVGGLSLIVSNIITLNDHYSCFTIKIVLITLAISIISGIIYRWAFYAFQIEYQKIEFYLKGAFSNREIMCVNPEDLSAETDYKRIVFKINNDFGKDFTNTIETYEMVDDETKKVLLYNLKTYYKENSEWAKNEFNIAMKYVDDVHKKAFGFSEKKIQKMKSENTTKKLKTYGIVTVSGFVISCLSFIFVVILLTLLF